MASFTPADWIELTKVASSFISAILVPLATIYIAIRVNKVSGNVDRLEKNTNSISERNQAIAMKLGITEGIAQERASVQANTSPPLPASSSTPLPVADEKTAAAVDRVTDAVSHLSKKA